MKDNKENLNNELGDDELEACAGGGRLWTWDSESEKFIQAYFERIGSDGAHAGAAMNEWSPAEFVQILKDNPTSEEHDPWIIKRLEEMIDYHARL